MYLLYLFLHMCSHVFLMIQGFVWLVLNCGTVLPPSGGY